VIADPLVIAIIAFVCVFGGALLGIRLGRMLPADHLDADSKDVVRLGMGIVATMVALVLGLLIASAKGFYDTQNSELTQVSANVVLLDQMLDHYGPQVALERAQLRAATKQWLDQLWSTEHSGLADALPRSTGASKLFDELESLVPKTDKQRELKGQALSVGMAIGQTRWLMYEQRATPIPLPLMIALIIWLTLVFISSGLFARANPTVIAASFAAALSVSGAMWLIMEMYQPYSGVIRISNAALQAALAQLGQ
jgi:hypothetical protein